jgi:hypothetical protein
MNHKRNVTIAVVLTAAAGFLALRNVSAPTPAQPPATVDSTVAEAFVPDQCAFTWAYQNAPDLTEKLDAAVKALNPAASGRVQFFGEDCTHADGHTTFGATETDFYVRSPVTDLTDEEALGNWVAQVMSAVTQIPQEEIQGRSGFVEFSNTDGQVFIRVPIQKYINEAQGKTGRELFQLLSNP